MLCPFSTYAKEQPEHPSMNKGIHFCISLKYGFISKDNGLSNNIAKTVAMKKVLKSDNIFTRQ